ncbi:hypothetical protein AMECASPLE_029986 [Ameca splendens]|uniref:Uncharacterized protein n=1 Tax=Ameca splendens TaxID=208324 RepID=A0ABV0YHA0_9TELE
MDLTGFENLSVRPLLVGDDVESSTLGSKQFRLLSFVISRWWNHLPSATRIKGNPVCHLVSLEALQRKCTTFPSSSIFYCASLCACMLFLHCQPATLDRT